jgi:multidrug resistance efflux pump
MSQPDESPRDLEHELANAEAKTRAAQHLLKRAAEEIEDLVEADCEDEQKNQASQAAERFRRAASL